MDVNAWVKVHHCLFWKSRDLKSHLPPSCLSVAAETVTTWPGLDTGLVAALAMVTCNWKNHADTCVEETSDGNVCVTDNFALYVSLSTHWSIPSNVFT